jgi:hypothetical protein
MNSAIRVTEQGAIGDGRTVDTAALQDALDRVHAAGGGRVILSAGHTFLTATLRLRDHLVLEFEPGAVLRAVTDINAYAGSRSACLLEAYQAENVTICGPGIIDGQSRAFVHEELEHIHVPHERRVGIFNLEACRRVVLRDVLIRHSSWWTVHLLGCENVLIDGITIDGDLKMPNSDGIDPDHCRDVRIVNCSISCADDGICLKTTAAGRSYGPTEDILVQNCRVRCRATAFKIGSESADDFRRITIANCIAETCSRGFGIQLRDQGNVDQVLVSNVIIRTTHLDTYFWGKAEPVHISAVRRFPTVAGAAGPEWNPENRLGTVSRVSIDHVIADAENGVVLYAEDPGGIRDVSLHDVRLTLEKKSPFASGLLDLRPCRGERHAIGGIAVGEGDPGVRPHALGGFLLHRTLNCRIDGGAVEWGHAADAYYTFALCDEESVGLTVERFEDRRPASAPR